jgi:ABC-type sugar transport system substrate-binding protein
VLLVRRGSLLFLGSYFFGLAVALTSLSVLLSFSLTRFCLPLLKFYRQLVYIIALVYTVTEVLSVRVKKSLKDEAEKLGVDLKVAVEQTLEQLVAEKKKKAQKVAKELSSLMDVNAEEWVNDVKATRHEM